MRTRQVKIRMTDGEYARLHERADRHSLSAADLIRHVVLGQKYARRLPDQEILRDIARQVSGIGRNVNQGIRAIHEARRSGELPPDVADTALADLDAFSAEVSMQLEALRKELRK